MRTGIDALSIALLLSSTSAYASEPTGEAIAASLKTFDEGRAAFEARRFEEARLAFEASYKLQASPNSLLYIGRCFRETGRIASAYVTLKRSEREAHDRLTATLEKRYAATRDAAAQEAAELEPRVPRLTIALPGGLPGDFSLTVNGRDVPRESWGLAVETDPGPIRIDARGARLRPFHEELRLEEGQNRRVDVRIERLPTATLVAILESRPEGVAIELDGSPIDPVGGAIAREVDVGAHRLIVTAPAHDAFKWVGVLVDGQRERVSVRLVPSSSSRGTPPWLFFTVGASAVATAAVGTVLALDATSADHDESAKNPFARDPAARDEIQTQATVANVLFASAAVLGIGATVLAFTTGWHRNVDKAVVGPWIANAGGGVSLGGKL